MALSYKWPEVYPTITDLSQIVTANSETVCAYVGEAEYGPINKPVNVSGLKGFVDTFGNLNPRYGLSGYSIAVAQDTINSHYFVRVVDEDTAKYGSTAIPCEGKTIAQPVTDGYDVGGESGIQPIIEAEGDVASAVFSALSDTDRANTAMIVLASDPNNRDIKVTVADSTVIEAKAEYVASISYDYSNKAEANIGESSIVPGSSVSTQDVVYDSETAENNEFAAVLARLAAAFAPYNISVTTTIDATTSLPRVAMTIDSAADPDLLTFTLTGSETLMNALGLTAGTYDVENPCIGAPIDLEAEDSPWPVAEDANYGHLSTSSTKRSYTTTFADAVAELNTTFSPLGLAFSIDSSDNTVLITADASTIYELSDEAEGATLDYFGLVPGTYQGTLAGHAIEKTWPIQQDIGKVKVAAYPLLVTYNTTSALDNELDEIHCLHEGDKVVISHCSDALYNGTQVVKSVTDHSFTVEYNKILTTQVSGARWVKYPEITETTFNINVFETTGKLTVLKEQWENLTLYAHKDNNQNSTFVEDVINGNSKYITVYANPELDFTETQVSYVEKQAIIGGTSGKIGVEISQLNKGWEYYRDRSRTTVTLLMGSGYTSLAYQSKMLEIAEARRDCFCLFDTPKDKVSAENIIDWRKNDQGFTSYRGALSTPWVKTYDSIQGKSGFLMAPSAFLAKIIGTSEPWVAPAGLNRGMITSSVTSPVGLTAYFDETEGGNLYSNQLNCIIKNPGAGYVNWGQKTLQQKSSALDRINVARTVIFIETTLRDAARYQLFENNTAFLRTQITLQFSQFLDRVLAAGGLQKYQVICDDSNNTPYVIANNQLVIDIYLWPTYTAEYIILNTTVMGPDAQVSVSTSNS